MKSLERIFATVDGQPKDRPAFLLNASLYGSKLAGHPLVDHYTNPSAYADGQSAIRETYGPDLLLSPFLVAPMGEAFGSEARAPHRYAPNISRFAAGSAREAMEIPLPDVDSHPRLVYLRECVRLLAARYAGEVPIAGLLVSPVDMPPLIIGMEAWLETLLSEPDVARAFLDRLTPCFVALANAMLADGATLIALTANFCNPSIVPDRVIDSVTRPALADAFSAIKGPMVLHHGGPRLAPHLRAYLGLPNLLGVLVDPRDSLKDARSTLGEAPVLLGNVDGPGLETRTPEEVRLQCEAILADRAADARFILSTSSADISLDTPPENLQAMVEAICRFTGATP